MDTSRRDFLALTSKALSAGVLLPGLEARSPWRAAAPLAGGGSSAGSEDRCLVVIELSGGNDGLNAVVPFGDEAYYKARPTLAVPEKRVLKLDDALGLGLHPELTGLKTLWDQGMLALVNGVGYPQPSRSHFESMDIWHSAEPAGKVRRAGWLGRYLERRAKTGQTGQTVQGDDGAKGLQIGGELGLAMRAESYTVPSLGSLESLTLRTDPRSNQDTQLELQTIKKLSAGAREGESDDSPDALAFARRAFLAAMGEGERLRKLQGSYQPAVQYEGGLGQRLGLIARMIDGGFPTRVFYTATGGYDTHANQDGAHANLHRQFARAVADFLKDLRAHGHEHRVAVMAFSEFGRRVAENGSRGTDHGTAGPVFVAGGSVRGGIHSGHPSLTDLDQGDLKFTTDFRRVYATLLESWLSAEAESVLGGKFATLPLFGRRVV